MADQLGAIAGRFILLINDTLGTRAVFARFNLSEVETTYTVGSASAGAGKRVGELIVRYRGAVGVIGWGKPHADTAEIPHKIAVLKLRGGRYTRRLSCYGHAIDSDIFVIWQILVWAAGWIAF